VFFTFFYCEYNLKEKHIPWLNIETTWANAMHKGNCHEDLEMTQYATRDRINQNDSHM
jgi:hypothetical protein